MFLYDEAQVWLCGAPSSHTPSTCGDVVGVKFSQAAAAPADGELCKTTPKPAGAAKQMRCSCLCGCECVLIHDFIITSRSQGSIRVLLVT